MAKRVSFCRDNKQYYESPVVTCAESKDVIMLSIAFAVFPLFPSAGRLTFPDSSIIMRTNTGLRREGEVIMDALDNSCMLVALEEARKALSFPMQARILLL